MKYVDEFRNKKLIRQAARHIAEIMPEREIRFMEVCGTHTQNFLRFGLDNLLPDRLKLISGPGCPVCVSTQEYIDKAIAYAGIKNVIISTYGDMLRVPGSNSSLEKARAEGADLRVVYSALDSIKFARENPKKKIVFLAVGFETTAPTVALTVLAAHKEKIRNLFFFSSLRLIPPAMAALLSDRRLRLQGFLCPGHVSAVIGARPYAFIPRKFRIGCCIAGFEPLDILQGLYFLLLQVRQGRPRVKNQYRRVVKPAGNLKAKELLGKVFKPWDASWRGLGEIPRSGLKINAAFARFDAEKALPVKTRHYHISDKQKQCRCADVLKGLIVPKDCALFSRSCRPESPLGPCMVSREGSCSLYYRYGK
jgi:hydrogenase expression/formation protein HypD